MVQLEQLVDTQLKQLPNTHEVAGLLDDISFIATDNGLKLNRINWEPEIKHEFSTELPMRIEVVGTYHEIGKFTADMAALPRIVILESFTLGQGKEQGDDCHVDAGQNLQIQWQNRGADQMKLLCVLLPALLLTACGGQDDMDNYVAATKARKPVPIEPLPEIKPLFPDGLSPQRSAQPLHRPQPETSSAKVDAKVKPDCAQIVANREKEVLERYSLASLSMQGSLGKQQDSCGIRTLMVNPSGWVSINIWDWIRDG